MNKDFSQYLYLFLNDYLVLQRNCSPLTINSYKYTFKLLLKYLTEVEMIKVSDISFETITKERVKNFLQYLEDSRGCSITTRNQRLAAIKSFYSYIATDNIDNLKITQDIINIRLKKHSKKEMDYFSKAELKDYFNNINVNTIKGRRDLVLLSLLYDSATRVSEITNSRVENLRLDDSPCITVIGKGSKERTIPIMKETKNLLIQYIKENNLTQSSYLFSNSRKEKINNRTIELIVSKYNKTSKNITPHSLRRTKAIHLLEAGVDLIYIRDLLGHSSVTTTEIYARASVEYKNKMLSKVNSEVYTSKVTSWNKNVDLLEELLQF